ncbi:hypothetical protein HDV00_007881 [Rhizophlyctis rosea]|nr:hypothetical protein HDV00_007881 [Rhizophlyctis rosea]
MGDRNPQAWSDNAPIYEKSTHKITSKFAYAALEITGILPASKHEQKIRILDTATGTGNLPLKVAEAYTAAGLADQVEVEASDFAPGMIEILNQRVKENGYEKIIKAEVADAQTLSNPDEAFTHAFMIFGIFFLPDPMKGLRELHRSLVPGGKATLTSWGATDMMRLSKEVMHRLNPGGTVELGGSYGVDWSSPNYIGSLVEEAGFKSYEAHDPIEWSVTIENHQELLNLIMENPGIAERFAGKEEVKKKWAEVMIQVMQEWWPVEPFQLNMPGLAVVATK